MSLRTIVTVFAVFLGVVVLAGGIASIVIGHQNSSDIADRLKAQNISLRLIDPNAPSSAPVTNGSQARAVADKLDEDLKSIAPSYSALLNGKRFDPTNPKQLTYGMGLTLEANMNLAALAFGLTTVLLFNGILMVIIGIALITVAIAIWLYHVHRRGPAVT